jgi:hypothetical protein
MSEYTPRGLASGGLLNAGAEGHGPSSAGVRWRKWRGRRDSNSRPLIANAARRLGSAVGGTAYPVALFGGWHPPAIWPQSGSCSGTRISILVSR